MKKLLKQKSLLMIVQSWKLSTHSCSGKLEISLFSRPWKKRKNKLKNSLESFSYRKNGSGAKIEWSDKLCAEISRLGDQMANSQSDKTNSKKPDMFKWKHFSADIILWTVRWYCQFALSYRDIVLMMEERGLSAKIYRKSLRNCCVIKGKWRIWKPVASIRNFCTRT